jgi:hypothetical protein
VLSGSPAGRICASTESVVRRLVRETPTAIGHSRS